MLQSQVLTSAWVIRFLPFGMVWALVWARPLAAYSAVRLLPGEEIWRDTNELSSLYPGSCTAVCAERSAGTTGWICFSIVGVYISNKQLRRLLTRTLRWAFCRMSHLSSPMTWFSSSNGVDVSSLRTSDLFNGIKIKQFGVNVFWLTGMFRIVPWLEMGR